MNNKKADTWITKEAVIMVFAAILILGTFLFFNKLYASTIGNKDDGSIANFDKRLYADINDMMSDSSTAEYRTENYYLGAKRSLIGISYSYRYFLVGFDYDWDDAKKTYNTLIPSNINRPYKCGNSACLCLYKGEPESASEKKDQNVVSCKSEAFYGKNIVFSGESKTNPATKGSLRQDGSSYLILGGSDWKTQYTYIEKQYNQAEGKYYIYISKIQPDRKDDFAAIRKKKIDDSNIK